MTEAKATKTRPTTSKKIPLKCEMCGVGKRNTPLWYIKAKGKFYCSYCGMVTLVNSDSEEVQAGGYGGDDRRKTLIALGVSENELFWKKTDSNVWYAEIVDGNYTIERKGTLYRAWFKKSILQTRGTLWEAQAVCRDHYKTHRKEAGNG